MDNMCCWTYMFSRSHILLMVTMCYCVSSTLSSSCFPVEEGIPSTVSWSLSSDNTNIMTIIETRHITLSSCNISHTCIDFLPSQFKTSSLINEKNGEIHLVLNILNTSREFISHTEELRVVSSNFKLGNCTLLIFSKPKLITCYQEMMNNSFCITCLTLKTFPTAKGLFSGYTFGLITYNVSVISLKPIYYSTKCTLVIPAKYIRQGDYEILVTMYPNVTGDDRDIGFGTNISVSVVFEYPRVKLSRCPQVVKEFSRVDCSCDRVDRSLINVSMGWYAEQHNVEITQGLHNISFIATRTPKAVAQNVTCHRVSFYNELLIYCNTARIFPRPKCLFDIKFNNTPVRIANLTISYTSVELLDQPTYFTSNCTLSLSRISLEIGMYDVFVTMYPQIIGEETGVEFGTRASLSFYLDYSTISATMQWPQILASILGVNLFLLLLGLLVCYYISKGTENVMDGCVACNKESYPNNYDDVHEGYMVSYETPFTHNPNDNVGHSQEEVSNITVDFTLEANQYEHIDDNFPEGQVINEEMPGIVKDEGQYTENDNEHSCSEV